MSTPWVVQCDGAWCHKVVGVSAVVTSPTGIVVRYVAQLIFADDVHSTNNTTEYEALLLALRKMKSLGSANLHHQDRLQSDSETYRERERGKKPSLNEVSQES
jgi:ribonuclease HI